MYKNAVGKKLLKLTAASLIHQIHISSIKPTLKKVSKYENKFAKLQKKAAEFNFRNQLKTVKKKEFTMDEEEHGVTDNFFYPKAWSQSYQTFYS